MSRSALNTHAPEHRNRGIICDLDGTLYKNDQLQAEFETAYYNFVQRTLDLRSGVVEKLVSDTRKQLEHFNGSPPSELKILTALGIRVSEWLRHSEEVVCPENYLTVGGAMLKTLRHVRKRAWVDITTNTSKKLADRILTCLGINAQVDAIWTPEVFGVGKPSVPLYAHIACVRRLNADKLLVIGDRWHIDLAAAKELGMIARLVAGPEDAERAMLTFVSQEGAVPPI